MLFNSKISDTSLTFNLNIITFLLASAHHNTLFFVLFFVCFIFYIFYLVLFFEDFILFFVFVYFILFVVFFCKFCFVFVYFILFCLLFLLFVNFIFCFVFCQFYFVFVFYLFCFVCCCFLLKQTFWLYKSNVTPHSRCWVTNWELWLQFCINTIRASGIQSKVALIWNTSPHFISLLQETASEKRLFHIFNVHVIIGKVPLMYNVRWRFAHAQGSTPSNRPFMFIDELWESRTIEQWQPVWQRHFAWHYLTRENLWFLQLEIGEICSLTRKE